jgi:hypothetical protein
MTKIILETDASVLSRSLNSEEMGRGPYGALFRQIRELIRPYFSVCKIPVWSVTSLPVVWLPMVSLWLFLALMCL